jgi:hypothetical protein
MAIAELKSGVSRAHVSNCLELLMSDVLKIFLYQRDQLCLLLVVNA